MRYRIILNYCGAGFSGWQVQPGQESVQGAVESALGTLLSAPVQIVGAGRTDTGVSACGYVAHFDWDGEAPDCGLLRYKMNSLLPDGISVTLVEPAQDDFHARFDAVSRTYRYFLHRTKDPFLADRSYFYGYPELDFEAMNRAAALLLGKHNFTCFEKKGSDNRTSICTVTAAEWKKYTPAVCAGGGECWYFEISADRFLRNMVRAVTGTLLEVGRGKRSVEDFASLVLPPDFDAGEKPLRSLAGESVPGHALFLTEIRY